VKPPHFLVVLGALLVALFAVQRPAPQGDIFAAIPADQRVRFAQITEPELYAAKLAHGRAAPRYAVGLFGNSRALMVGARELGPAGGRFFNYAVPGSSFRTSVALAEDLARTGKLPRIVLISLDHLEIQFDGNPNTRHIGGWLRRVWRDAVAAITLPDISLRAGLGVVWRHIYVGYGGVTRYFNTEQLVAGIRWRLSDNGVRAWWSETVRESGSGYRRDGSRAAAKPANPATSGKPRALRPLPRAAPAVLIGYLREDLRRLAVLKRRGVRIIVYESPLHAASLERATHRPAPHAATMRDVFLRACVRLRLECHDHRTATVVAAAKGWRDATHPPAEALAAYLSDLIARAPVKVRNDGAGRQRTEQRGARAAGTAR